MFGGILLFCIGAWAGFIFALLAVKSAWRDNYKVEVREIITLFPIFLGEDEEVDEEYLSRYSDNYIKILMN